MIRVGGTYKAYRTGKVVHEVLSGVDFEINDGEFVSIVGPSGSGKSTLLHAIGGLDRDYTGTIVVDGKDLATLSDAALSDYRNRSVGFVFQSFYLLPHLTVLENVALPAVFARGGVRTDEETAHTRAREVLKLVDLGERTDSTPTTLSGGQRQRVAIARALFHRPKLLLCDEPTGNLDSKMGGQIIDIFRRLNAEAKITVIIVTHDPRISTTTTRTLRVADGTVTDDRAGATRPSNADAEAETPIDGAPLQTEAGA